MLANSPAFGSFSTNNIEQSKDFYENVLSIKVKINEMKILELHLKDCKVIIYPKKNHRAADFTVLNFKVKDIEKTVDKLIEKGIVFEQYEGEIGTDKKGIAKGQNGPKIAWFKDPSGNILSIIQE